MQAGVLRHRVSLDEMATDAADGDGGTVPGWSALTPPAVWASITRPPQAMERAVAGTVQSSATHLVTVRYHPEITTRTRITWGTRQFQVIGVGNPDERNISLELVCVEVIA